MDKKFFPIILGSDENAYATARCFNDEYGIKPLCLCSKALVQTERSKILTVKAVKDFDKPEVFIKTLLSELRAREDMGKLIVIPCADYYTELLVKNYGIFEGRIVSSALQSDVPTQTIFLSLLCNSYHGHHTNQQCTN
jgi:D-aspartate ligase